MKFISFIVFVFLSALSLSKPLQAIHKASSDAKANDLSLQSLNIKTPSAEAEAAGVVKRANVQCHVIHVATTVRCQWIPTHKALTVNPKIAEVKPSDYPHFYCWTKCQKVEGITTWFWTYGYDKTIDGTYYKGCYIPGYYLDNNCVSTGSGHLNECDWSDSVKEAAGC